MHTIKLEIPEILHGHGLSFKKGISDGLLDNRDHEATPHEPHAASYQRGVEVGTDLKATIDNLVKA